jgi:hypothetical protein
MALQSGFKAASTCPFRLHTPSSANHRSACPSRVYKPSGIKSPATARISTIFHEAGNYAAMSFHRFAGVRTNHSIHDASSPLNLYICVMRITVRDSSVAALSAALAQGVMRGSLAQSEPSAPWPAPKKLLNIFAPKQAGGVFNPCHYSFRQVYPLHYGNIKTDRLYNDGSTLIIHSAA